MKVNGIARESLAAPISSTEVEDNQLREKGSPDKGNEFIQHMIQYMFHLDLFFF